MRGASYPVLVPTDGPGEGDPVDGLLVHGITAEDEARLVRFEGNAYRQAEVTVEGRRAGRVIARCFLPLTPDLADRRPWDFTTWRRRDRTRYLSRIRRRPIAAG